jgi:hypothetical protein
MTVLATPTYLARFRIYVTVIRALPRLGIAAASSRTLIQKAVAAYSWQCPSARLKWSSSTYDRRSAACDREFVPKR